MVEDVPDLLDVHGAEGLGHGLGDTVGDGVRMADTFPLDDLDLPLGDGDLLDPVDVNILLGRHMLHFKIRTL